MAPALRHGHVAGLVAQTLAAVLLVAASVAPAMATPPLAAAADARHPAEPVNAATVPGASARVQSAARVQVDPPCLPRGATCWGRPEPCCGGLRCYSIIITSRCG